MSTKLLTDFSVEMNDLVAICYDDTLDGVVANIKSYLPQMDEKELKNLALNTIEVLGALSEEEFKSIDFLPSEIN